MATPAEEQRKLLNQLMGSTSSRHHNHSSKNIKFKYNDPKICKAFLIGSCPYDLFQGTKQNIGHCPQLHSLKLKLQFDKIKNNIDTTHLEHEYCLILKKFIDDCNGKIKLALIKLKHTPEETERIRHATRDIDLMDRRIALIMREINILLKRGNLQRAMKQSYKLNKYKIERISLSKRIKLFTENVGQSSQQKLQVCEICGAFLSRLDTDRRLADHFMGKIHLGYVKMRHDYNHYKQRTIK